MRSPSLPAAASARVADASASAIRPPASRHRVSSSRFSTDRSAPAACEVLAAEPRQQQLLRALMLARLGERGGERQRRQERRPAVARAVHRLDGLLGRRDRGRGVTGGGGGLRAAQQAPRQPLGVPAHARDLHGGVVQLRGGRRRCPRTVRT